MYIPLSDRLEEELHRGSRRLSITNIQSGWGQRGHQGSRNLSTSRFTSRKAWEVGWEPIAYILLAKGATKNPPPLGRPRIPASQKWHLVVKVSGQTVTTYNT